MSSTRYASPTADPDSSPERKLASGRLRGISIGLNIIARVARVLPERERDAMIWLHNYAQLRDLTADALSDELDLEKADIRRALTDPDADRTRFVRQVTQLRNRFESAREEQRPPGERSAFNLKGKFDEALGSLASTKVTRKVSNAVKMAMRSPQICEVLGKWRMGKSIAARHEFLGLLHCAAWLHCPKPGFERDFYNACADAFGVSLGTSEKNPQILPKLEACIGPNRIRILFVDEGHRLWPSDWRHEPKRIELLRDWWERLGLSIIILSTEQSYVEALSAAMQSQRWAPGQWVGRVQPFDLADTLPDDELAAVARHHIANANNAVVAQCVSFAKTSAGYIGAMVRAIERAQFREDGKALTVDAIKDAQRQVDREERLAHIALLKAKAATKAKQPIAKVTPLRRAA